MAEPRRLVDAHLSRAAMTSPSSRPRRAIASASVPLIVLGGHDFGTGSSRDWAAKGPALLGVRAVIARSFERIHRSNLIGVGIVPLLFARRDSVDDARARRQRGIRLRRASPPASRSTRRLWSPRARPGGDERALRGPRRRPLRRRGRPPATRRHVPGRAGADGARLAAALHFQRRRSDRCATSIL